MKIPVCMKSDSYDIILERGALARAGELLQLNRRVLIVTDDGVPAAYSGAVAAACRQPTTVTLPQGESTKNSESYLTLLRTMADAGFSRGDCVVAVGGGVMGDLAGFAAATYMRGVDFYNIPTTLLSMVDSSIGGKVAIDLDSIKNIVGAFYHPRRVLIDPDVLRTLSSRQIRAGLAEAIKMAATCDAGLLEDIENMDPARTTDEQWDRIIEGALRIKKSVVQEDPTEKGLRRVLNFGHTVGHAIESSQHGRYLHGECVALGMLPMCAPDVRDRLRRLLERWELPTHVCTTPDELRPYLCHDKKMSQDSIITVHVETMGSYVFCRETVPEILSGISCVLDGNAE